MGEREREREIGKEIIFELFQLAANSQWSKSNMDQKLEKVNNKTPQMLV